MWHKCLNPNCGFVFSRITKCDRCPDCGKQHLREATNEEIESVKPSLDDVIRGIEANKPQSPKSTNKNDEDKNRGEISPETHPIYKEHEIN